MHRWTVVGLAAVLGATLALPAAAQWKWRDASGHTLYSDTAPPSSIPEKDILQRPSAPIARAAAPAASAAASAASGAAAPLVDSELEAKRKKAEQDAADKKKAEDAKTAAARAESCSRARSQMKTFDSGLRIARINAKGEREYLDDTARAQEVQRTQQIIASDCK